jgi:phosphate transport system protein
MTKHFHRDVERLQSQILALSARVEQMIDQAGRALFQRDTDLLDELIDADREIDQREVLIEEECLKMLALHQPVAIDLRRIAVVLKINNDLERIADLAVNIAERAEHLQERPDFRLPPTLGQMVDWATAMVRGALDAFVDSDPEAAREICRRDDDVDEANREIITELIDMMEREPTMIAPAMHCFSASRQVERIADHATNIAEDVIYLVEGDIVRHKHGSDLTPVSGLE